MYAIASKENALKIKELLLNKGFNLWEKGCKSRIYIDILDFASFCDKESEISLHGGESVYFDINEGAVNSYNLDDNSQELVEILAKKYLMSILKG